VAVSVIIAARNAAHRIGTMLGALAEQTLPREYFETIVVDDGSSDDTAKVAERCALTRVIRADRHVGLPAARNLGIEAASAELLAFTDRSPAGS
jgi:glycosyltransferase involved in cell wall biosynthesis